MKKLFFLALIVIALGRCSTHYTAIQQQDAANALSCVREAKALIAKNAPVSAPLVEIPDTAAIGSMVPQDARDWRDALTLLGLAETSLFSMNEEFKTRPLQHETARVLVDRREYSELARIAAAAKLQAGRNVLDKYSIQLWGVTFTSLCFGIGIFGILAVLKAKNPAAAELFKKFVGAFQVTRTESPIEIAKQISERFEGVDAEAVAAIVRNSMDQSLRAKLPENVQAKISELKKQMGLKTEA